jgi:PKD repeat protein
VINSGNASTGGFIANLTDLYPGAVIIWLTVFIGIGLIACAGMLLFYVFTKDTDSKKQLKKYFALLMSVLLFCSFIIVIISLFTASAQPAYAPAPPPDALFNAYPATGLAPLTVSFEGTTDGWGEYIWDFGDGSPKERQNTSVSRSTNHTYTQPGTYLVQLTAMNPGWNSVSVLNVIVTTPAPEVLFNWSAMPEDPRTIHFEDITNYSSPAVMRIWKFGDANGSVSFEQNPTHTYPGRGKPTVELTVVDQSGKTSTKAQKILVSELCDVSPAYDSYKGEWVNITPTVNITKLEMTVVNSAILVHALEGCSPELCDWGIVPLCPYNRDWLVAEFRGNRFLFMRLGDNNQLRITEIISGKLTSDTLVKSS